MPNSGILHHRLLTVTRQALHDVCWGWPPLLNKVAIHSDGATAPLSASWANIIIGTDLDDREWFMGTVADLMPVPGDPAWIGADKSTSSSSELTGITWALQVLLQLSGKVPCAEIWYDSKYASGIPKHSFHLPRIASWRSLQRDLTHFSRRPWYCRGTMKRATKGIHGTNVQISLRRPSAMESSLMPV